MLEQLERWQTLIGGILGGVFALGAALVVSSRLERRQDLSAAMLVTGTLVGVAGALREVEEWCDEESIDPEREPLRAFERLLFSYPKMSSGFEASAVRLYPINETLAVRLDVFRGIYSDLEKRLRRMESDISGRNDRQEPLFQSMGVEPQANAALVGLQSAGELASDSIKLLEFLVLTRIPTLNRLRVKIWPPKYIREILERRPDAPE